MPGTEDVIAALLEDPSGPAGDVITREVGRARTEGVPILPGGGRLGEFLNRPLAGRGRSITAPATPTEGLEAPAEGRVRLERSDGAVVEVDAVDVDTALAQRDRAGNPVFQLDTPELEARRARRREFGGRGLEAGLTSALGGATLGLSDVAIGGLGGGEYLEGLREFNPEAAMLGEIGGAVAPVLLAGPAGLAGAAEATAGRGLLRTAVAGVGLPTRLLAGAAEGLGAGVAGVARGAAPGAARRVGSTVLGLATEGAVEGVVGEGARMLSETAIGDGNPGLTAEMVLARLGSSALLGGGTGGVLGGAGGIAAEAGRGGARLVGAGADVVSRAWRDSVGTELSPIVADTYARVASALSGRRVDDIRRFVDPTPEGRALRGLIDRGDDVFEEGSREMVGAMSAAERALHAIPRRWREGLRTDEMERLVNPSRFADQVRSADEMVSELESRIAMLAEDFAGTDIAGRARGLAASIRTRRRALETALEAGPSARTSAEVNAALNGAKRDVQGLLRRVRGMGPASEALDALERRIRTSLEDSDLWGEAAATAHREVNADFALWLTTRERFAQRFLETGGTGAGRADYNMYDAIPQADSGRVSAYLRGAGMAANDTAETTFRETIESGARLLDTMGRHLNLSDSERVLLEEARRESANALRLFDRVRHDAVALNQWNRLTNGGSDAIGRHIIGTAAGSALGGPLGAVLAGAAMSPAYAIRAMATVERWTGGAAGEIASSVRGFLSPTARRVTRVADEGSRAIARRLRSAAVLTSVRAYEARIRQLEEDSGNPRVLVERMADRVVGMESTPETRDAMLATAARGVSYLSRVRPHGGSLPGQILPQESEPSAEDRARFLRVARVVDDPLSVLRSLREGTLDRESVQALREVYPNLYQRIVQEVVAQLAERGSNVSYDRRLALGDLLGIPTDPASTPAHMATLQSVMAQPVGEAQAAPNMSRPPNLSSAEYSGTDALEASS